MMESPLIIYYDGFCILCSRAMDFSIKYDHKKIVHYSPMQSNFAQKNLDKKYINDMNTVIVKRGNETFTKSKAAFVVLNALNHPLRYLQFFFTIFFG